MLDTQILIGSCAPMITLPAAGKALNPQEAVRESRSPGTARNPRPRAPALRSPQRPRGASRGGRARLVGEWEPQTVAAQAESHQKHSRIHGSWEN